jgi:hypothetical protein
VTQIANLPQIDGTRTAFTIAKNARFQFSIAFPFPAGPQVPLVAVCAIVAGSATLAGLPTGTVAALVTGQPVAGYGIPDGTIIAAIPSATSVTLSAAATQTAAAIGLTFQPLPLDITGISFLMQVRTAATNAGVYLEMSTDNGLLINGGTSGVFGGDASPDDIASLPLTAPGATLVTDIVATAADGGPINLMAVSGPASVTVLPGVSRS